MEAKQTNGKKSKYTLFERIVLCILVLTPVVLLILYIVGNMGIARKNVEKDARESQRIEADWQVTKDSSDWIEAMIFYDDAQTDYTASIYVRDDLLTIQGERYPLGGFSFRMGGKVLEWNDEITEIKVDDRGYVIASMNDIGVAKIEIGDNGERRIIEMDDGEPFIAAVSEKSSVSFYGADGQLLDVWSVNGQN